jgi:hypothetical protein
MPQALCLKNRRLMEELAPPEEALTDPNSVELLRAWLSKEELIITLQSMDFPGGAVTYGMVCADIARHAADMLHKGFGYPKAVTLAEICRVFIDEIKTDSGYASGDFIEPRTIR